jgi:hypothetical protein
MARKAAQERARYASDVEYAQFKSRQRSQVWRQRHGNVVRNLWRRAKERAKQKGLPFSIDVSDVVIPERCPVLGIAIKKATGRLHDYSPSLDRIRPELGYVKGNTRIISQRANRLKCDGTAAEMKLIYEDLLRIESGG